MGFAISIILKYAAHEKIQPYSGVIRSMDATIDQKIEELQGLCRKSLKERVGPQHKLSINVL